MNLAPVSEPGPSLMLIETGLTLVAAAVAFCWPRIASPWFSRIDRAFTCMARRKRLSVAVTGAAALFGRLAILPFCPIPLPFIHDDFSFLLAGNTFALGRLANPTPTMWKHFESFQITMQPTYMSMYFPAQGLVLAAGKVLFGNSWIGLLCVTALMCAAICWMLQAWLPPTWALLGGMLAVLRLGLFSYWINTYSGGGSTAALGGALVLGALPRLTRRARLRDGLLMAAGIILMLLCRPFEGMLLCIPVAFVLGRWFFFGQNRPPATVLGRRAAMPLALIVAAVAWLGYYDYRAFGDPLTLPYTVDRATYAAAPYWVWATPRPEPVYRHKVMRDFYVDYELNYVRRLRTLSGFVSEDLFFKPLRQLLFFAGIALLPPFIMLRRVLLDRRIRFLLVCVAVLAVGMLSGTFLIPHYLAPFTAAFYAIGLQAMRHLRLWNPEQRPVGLAMVRSLVTVCIVLAGIRLFAEPLHLRLAAWPGSQWSSTWHGPGRLGVAREQIKRKLEQLPGKQLAIIRYSPQHSSLDEWVYDAPDIDDSKVVWSREMDAASDLEIIHYYKDRTAWLVQPDLDPAAITPYPAPE